MKFIKTLIALPFIILLAACQKSLEEPKPGFCVINMAKNIADASTNGYPNTHSRYIYDDKQRIVKQMDFETLSGNDTIITIDVTYKTNEIIVVEQETGGGDDYKYIVTHKLEGDKVVSSVTKHKGVDTKSRLYEYNPDGTLARQTISTYTNTPTVYTSVIEYSYKNGNCIAEKYVGQDYTITYEYYEDKLNPAYLNAINHFDFIGRFGTTPVSRNLLKSSREEAPTSYLRLFTLNFSYDYNSSGNIQRVTARAKSINEDNEEQEAEGTIEFEYKCN